MTGINVSRWLEMDAKHWLRVLSGFECVRVMNWLPVTIPTHLASEAWRATTADELIHGPTNTARGSWFVASAYPALADVIGLINMVGAKLWLCVPHTLALEEASTLIRYAADHALHGVIVEYSNEVWNRHFVATYALGETAVEAMIASAEITIQLAKDASTLPNVQFVFSGWAASVWHSEQVFAETDIADYVDALAIAPYFGMNTKTVADAAATIQQAKTRSQAHFALADAHGLELWHYEQGSHLTANSAEINRSPQMGALMAQYDREMASAGATLRCWYSAATAFQDASSFGLYEVKDNRPLMTAKVAAARMTTT